MVIEERPIVQDYGLITVPDSQPPSVNQDSATGRFVPGNKANPYGRPRKGESYAEIAAGLANRTKRTVVAAMVKRATKGDVRAAEYLTWTAEGKPAVRVIHEESPALAALLGTWQEKRQAIEAEYRLVDEAQADTIE